MTTNRAFAERVGIHFTHASRLRNGQRLPSIDVLNRISKEYGLPVEELVKQHQKGPAAFGRYLQKHVFGQAA